MDDLTPRQWDEVHKAIRHVGRAMAAMRRANLPPPPRFGHAPNWWLSLDTAERLIDNASDKLIDATEGVYRYYDDSLLQEVGQCDQEPGASPDEPTGSASG